jgi:hypothetical protein
MLSTGGVAAPNSKFPNPSIICVVEGIVSIDPETRFRKTLILLTLPVYDA